MKSSDIALVFAAFLCLGAGPKHTWWVVGVTDGDSITCLTGDKQQVKVRLNAIDAPERGQPFANKSKQALSDMVFGKDVEVEELGTDRYKRTIGLVTVGELDVNHEMVAKGMAWHYVKYDDSKVLVMQSSQRVLPNSVYGLIRTRHLRGNGGSSTRMSGSRGGRFRHP